jgi:two-component system response regulator GlrR
LLTYLGAFVVTAKSAHEARNKVKQVRADLVVCDIPLGDKDAMWLLGEVRRLGIDTPFIAVSGHDYDTHAMQAAGFIAYLPKPIDHELLARAILSAIVR